MRIKKLGAAACILCCLTLPETAYASDGEGYVTISVEATDDNGKQLKYALDTDDEEAFTETNEFRIPEGTSHTIYVKDAAGNVTSQTYHPDPDEDESGAEEYADIPASSTASEDGQRINIDLEIGGTDYSDYEYLTDEPVEAGAGTMAEKIRTDGSDSDDVERIFYTITTKEGEVLYLVIDQNQSSNNVYLMDTVSVGDLLALADGSGKADPDEKKEDNLLSALSKEKETVADSELEEDSKEASDSSPFIYIILSALVGGIYYYFKIYKNKKDEAMDAMDAMDMEDFEAGEDEEEEELEFDDEDKKRYLEDLINEEKELYDADPDEYAGPHTAGGSDPAKTDSAQDFGFGAGFGYTDENESADSEEGEGIL